MIQMRVQLHHTKYQVMIFTKKKSNNSNECTPQKESAAKHFWDASLNCMEPESGRGPERKINHVPEVKPIRRADVFVK